MTESRDVDESVEDGTAEGAGRGPAGFVRPDRQGGAPSGPGAGVRAGIWSLAGPSILGNLLFAMVAMVQTKAVGELGASALAAVGAGQRVFFALQAVMMAIGAGTTALVARAWGAGEQREASRVTMASLVLGTAFALVLSVIGVSFATPVAGVFGLDAHTVGLAADNIRVLSLFNVMFAINFILSSALRAAGDAWRPLMVGAVVNLANLPMLYWFVFGGLGVPALGVAGAALAGGVSFSIGAVILIWLWMRQRLTLRYVAGGWFRRERLKRLLNIGYPAGVEQVIFQAGFFAFLMIIGRNYGTEAFAAYNIGVNMLMVGMVVGFGFSIAGSTLVGQHLGAGDYDSARRSGWRSCAMAMTAMALLGAVVIALSDELARFFLEDDETTIRYTVQFTWILGAMMPLMAVEAAIGGALRGAGDTRFPLVATFVGLIGMRCTLAAVFTFAGLPVVWVYAAMIGDYVAKAVLLSLRFRSGRWRHVVSNRELDLA